ncbi:MAG: hypothetical protein RIR45_1573, partial [Pseudomonadota bacterium]
GLYCTTSHQFIKDEFIAFLAIGILAECLLRLFNR